MTNPDYFHDLGHILVAGATGSKPEYGGKTTTCNAWATWGVRSGEFDAAIFFNPKHDSGVKGFTVRSIRRLADAMGSGERLIDFRPESTDGAQEHENLREFVSELEETRLIVVHDECSSYPDSLAWFLKRGGNESDCKSLAVSQNPYEIDSTVRSNLHSFVWVGPPTGSLQTFAQRSAWPEEIHSVVKERHTEPYCWTVFDGNTADGDTYGPVHGGWVA